MATEIERKFLVNGDQWRSLAVGQRYCQGYLPTQDNVTVRVRIVGEKAYLTLKGPTQGMSRSEFEYDIPVTDAEILLNTLCQRPWIEKWRYRIPMGDLVWEVDEFLGENQGLILAEVELVSEDQTFDRPDWIGPEVTGDRRYYNSNLVNYPYQQWSATEPV
ncbi:MAG: CYTH domain-containing protein [Microcystaceae cyanobacterium]